MPPPPPPPQYTLGWVAGDALRLRSSPNGALVRWLYRNDPVQIVGQVTVSGVVWYRLLCGNYVMASGISATFIARPPEGIGGGDGDIHIGGGAPPATSVSAELAAARNALAVAMANVKVIGVQLAVAQITGNAFLTVGFAGALMAANVQLTMAQNRLNSVNATVAQIAEAERLAAERAAWLAARAVQCPPIGDIQRGRAVEYLAMDFHWPIGTHLGYTGRENWNYISSRFGWCSDRYHNGLDFTGGGHPHLGSTVGAPVLAVTSGLVIDVRTCGGGRGEGNTITIRSDTHRDPVTGHYLIFSFMHMQAPAAREDGTQLRYRDRVSRGEQVGRVGNTGASDTSRGHLHLEVSNHGTVRGPGDTLRDRIVNRINPRFFYPHDYFRGTTTMWQERRS